MKRTITRDNLLVAMLAGSMACLVLGTAHPAAADGFGDDTRSCAADRPCFNAVYQSGTKVVFQFTGIADWEFYNVRYGQAGHERQVENRSGSFTFTDTQPDRTYQLSVQGCNAHLLARSTCSPWSEASFTTAAPASPPPPTVPSKTLGRLPPGKTLGRVTQATPGAPRSICEAAQDARARSSPAAPDLEAQCRAATGGHASYYRLQLKQGGKYLDAVHCSDQVALNAGSSYADGACQLWRFVPAGDGWNRLQLKQGGTYLDASYCSDHVVLGAESTYADGACQLWRLVPAGDGWSRLQVKQGGKYLDAVHCSDQVALNAGSTYADGACQLWRLVDARGPAVPAI
jgi:ricin-type beta-trefoil lectin protein